MSKKSSTSNSDLGLLVFRILSGSALFFGHGLPKLLNFSILTTKFPDELGVGSVVGLCLALALELFGSLAVILGFSTRLVSSILAVALFLSTFYFHWQFPWTQKESPFLFASAFLALAITGPGRFSVDSAKKKKS